MGSYIKMKSYLSLRAILCGDGLEWLTHSCPPFQHLLSETFALRDDSALRALSSLRGLREAPEAPPLYRETSVSRTANVGTVGMNGLKNGAVNKTIVGLTRTKKWMNPT